MENPIEDFSSTDDLKHYTDLSTVNHRSFTINSIYNDTNYISKSFDDKDKAIEENAAPFSSYHSNFFTDSSFPKRYYTETTDLDLLKTEQQTIEMIKTDSMEFNFTSTHVGNGDRHFPLKDMTNLTYYSLNEMEKTADNFPKNCDDNFNIIEAQEEKNYEQICNNMRIRIDERQNNQTNEETVKHGENVAIKSEISEDDIKDMITILVPQDVDMKNVKLEPEDVASNNLKNIDSETVTEIDDNEDFYIIQVQDSSNNPSRDEKMKNKTKKTRTSNKILISKCDLCEYNTFDKSNLRKHKLIHTDLKPYSCDLCSFTCKLPKYLKQHMVTHMTMRLFPCTVCCHRCRNLTELNRHIKRHLKINNRASLDDLTDEEKLYCVCRDGCKTGGTRKIKRDRKSRETIVNNTI